MSSSQATGMSYKSSLPRAKSNPVLVRQYNSRQRSRERSSGSRPASRPTSRPRSDHWPTLESAPRKLPKLRTTSPGSGDTSARKDQTDTRRPSRWSRGSSPPSSVFSRGASGTGRRSSKEGSPTNRSKVHVHFEDDGPFDTEAVLSPSSQDGQRGQQWKESNAVPPSPVVRSPQEEPKLRPSTTAGWKKQQQTLRKIKSFNAASGTGFRFHTPDQSWLVGSFVAPAGKSLAKSEEPVSVKYKRYRLSKLVSKYLDDSGSFRIEEQAEGPYPLAGVGSDVRHVYSNRRGPRQAFTVQGLNRISGQVTKALDTLERLILPYLGVELVLNSGISSLSFPQESVDSLQDIVQQLLSVTASGITWIYSNGRAMKAEQTTSVNDYFLGGGKQHFLREILPPIELSLITTNLQDAWGTRRSDEEEAESLIAMRDSNVARTFYEKSLVNDEASAEELGETFRSWYCGKDLAARMLRVEVLRDIIKAMAEQTDIVKIFWKEIPLSAKSILLFYGLRSSFILQHFYKHGAIHSGVHKRFPTLKYDTLNWLCTDSAAVKPFFLFLQESLIHAADTMMAVAKLRAVLVSTEDLSLYELARMGKSGSTKQTLNEQLDFHDYLEKTVEPSVIDDIATILRQLDPTASIEEARRSDQLTFFDISLFNCMIEWLSSRSEAATHAWKLACEWELVRRIVEPPRIRSRKRKQQVSTTQEPEEPTPSLEAKQPEVKDENLHDEEPQVEERIPEAVQGSKGEYFLQSFNVLLDEDMRNVAKTANVDLPEASDLPLLMAAIHNQKKKLPKKPKKSGKSSSSEDESQNGILDFLDDEDSLKLLPEDMKERAQKVKSFLKWWGTSGDTGKKSLQQWSHLASEASEKVGSQSDSSFEANDSRDYTKSLFQLRQVHRAVEDREALELLEERVKQLMDGEGGQKSSSDRYRRLKEYHHAVKTLKDHHRTRGTVKGLGKVETSIMRELVGKRNKKKLQKLSQHQLLQSQRFEQERDIWENFKELFQSADVTGVRSKILNRQARSNLTNYVESLAESPEEEDTGKRKKGKSKKSQKKEGGSKKPDPWGVLGGLLNVCSVFLDQAAASSGAPVKTSPVPRDVNISDQVMETFKCQAKKVQESKKKSRKPKPKTPKPTAAPKPVEPIEPITGSPEPAAAPEATEIEAADEREEVAETEVAPETPRYSRKLNELTWVSTDELMDELQELRAQKASTVVRTGDHSSGSQQNQVNEEDVNDQRSSEFEKRRKRISKPLMEPMPWSFRERLKETVSEAFASALKTVGRSPPSSSGAKIPVAARNGSAASVQMLKSRKHSAHSAQINDGVQRWSESASTSDRRSAVQCDEGTPEVDEQDSMPEHQDVQRNFTHSGDFIETDEEKKEMNTQSSLPSTRGKSRSDGESLQHATIRETAELQTAHGGEEGADQEAGDEGDFHAGVHEEQCDYVDRHMEEYLSLDEHAFNDLYEALYDSDDPAMLDEEQSVASVDGQGKFANPRLSSYRRNQIEEEIRGLTELRAKQIEEEERVKRLEEAAAQRTEHEKQLNLERRNDPEGLTIAERRQKTEKMLNRERNGMIHEDQHSQAREKWETFLAEESLHLRKLKRQSALSAASIGEKKVHQQWKKITDQERNREGMIQEDKISSAIEAKRRDAEQRWMKMQREAYTPFSPSHFDEDWEEYVDRLGRSLSLNPSSLQEDGLSKEDYPLDSAASSCHGFATRTYNLDAIYRNIERRSDLKRRLPSSFKCDETLKSDSLIPHHTESQSHLSHIPSHSWYDKKMRELSAFEEVPRGTTANAHYTRYLEQAASLSNSVSALDHRFSKTVAEARSTRKQNGARRQATSTGPLPVTTGYRDGETGRNTQNKRRTKQEMKRKKYDTNRPQESSTVLVSIPEKAASRGPKLILPPVVSEEEVIHQYSFPQRVCTLSVASYSGSLRKDSSLAKSESLNHNVSLSSA
eukprot:gb/GECG01006751.1/.p1 GENE.gb/GECG01006751.1/~~gb/GECG01006751.1/.p1  ORF type:complete len:1943 (+),score=307.76 gb/GECG01006751.1/:1-5829(+)